MQYLQAEVSRGGKNTRMFNTTNIVNHLKTKHDDEYWKYEKEKAAQDKDGELKTSKWQ